MIISAIADNKRPQRRRSSGDLLLPLDDKKSQSCNNVVKLHLLVGSFLVKLKQTLIFMTLKEQSSKEGARSIS